MRSFPLAPMSPLIIVVTALVLAVPVVFAVTGVWAGNAPLLWVAVLIAAGCWLVWLWIGQSARRRCPPSAGGPAPRRTLGAPPG